MTTTFFFMGRLRAYEIEKREAGRHADQPPDAELPVRKLRERCHDALHRLRIEKRQDAFQNEIERERRQQVGPIHRPVSGAWIGSGT